ncbi:MAG: hypothetical protein KF830_02795 [Planctomycetes bacterium]|nr:hypothetical protein [Planctomycetota bacterium]
MSPGPFLARAPAQAPPLGWGVSATFSETAQPLQVRALLQWDARQHVVAVAHEVYLLGGQRTARSRPVLDLGASDDVAFLAPYPGGLVAAGSLVSAVVWVLDPRLGAITSFPGVRNAFDAIALGADLLVSANPLWPQGGAQSGVWLVGPGRTPREILPLVGPSAPLLLRANGDLVVGELGSLVPPPAGTARLLQVPALRVAAAMAGATLSMADVASVGSGFDGFYDLTEDDAGRIHATDPMRSRVVHTAPGGLVPVGTTIDLGPGAYALGLQFVPLPSAPFRGFQPADTAPRLAVGSTDYATHFTWRQMHAARPRLQPTATAVPPGPFPIDLANAPPQGLALVLASLAGSGGETVVATLGGIPLWLGLDPLAAIPLATGVVALDGSAHLVAPNPGGQSIDIDVQVLAWDAFGTGDLGTTAPRRLHLLP